MVNFFKRLFKIGEAEANSALDKMEDPINMTEQGIRDMKRDLEKNVEALAQVRALAIRSRNDHESYEAKAKDYEQKAMLLLKKAQSGDLDTAEADRLAKEALIKKEEASQEMKVALKNVAQTEKSVAQLENNIQEIKKSIGKWENELRTLKARVKVSKATKNLNKQMAEIDGHSTVSMLERMKNKVEQEEALAEAYGDIANTSKSIDDEINSKIDVTEENAEDSLAKLKEQLGITEVKKD